jgi:RHS repeat-associated protein
VWRKTAAGGESSVSIGYPLFASVSAVAGVYRGVDPSNPIDAVASGASSSGTSVTAGSVTASAGGDRLVLLEGAAGNSSAGSWSASGGMSQQAQTSSSTSVSAGIADQSQSGVGASGSRTATFGVGAGLVGELVALRPVAVVPVWFVQDASGSTRALTDVDGAVVGAFSYDPYGRLVGSTGTVTTSLGYQGQYTDPSTGFMYLRARWYDPATAQFLTRDPLESVTRAPYAYAGDDPLDAGDPSGLNLAGKIAAGLAIVTVDAVEEVGSDGAATGALPAEDAAIEELLGGADEAADSSADTGAGGAEDTAEAEESASNCAEQDTDEILTNLHHADPKFLGGDPAQELTEMPLAEHQALHRDLNAFLRDQEDEFGNHMRPQRGNSGGVIRGNFSRGERLDALAQFYSGPGARYGDAAASFFRQHPGLAP